MTKLESTTEERIIETTIGDLICAIADAANEVSIDAAEIAALTQVVLNSMLSRYQH